MDSQNYIQVVGFISTDLSIKEYNGTFRYGFSVSVKSKDSEQAKPEVVPIVFWKNQPSEQLAELKKGDHVFLDGFVRLSLSNRSTSQKWFTDICGVTMLHIDAMASEGIINHMFKRYIVSHPEIRSFIKKADTVQLSKPFFQEIEALAKNS
jgi:hypothetical protein